MPYISFELPRERLSSENYIRIDGSEKGRIAAPRIYKAAVGKATVFVFSASGQTWEFPVDLKFESQMVIRPRLDDRGNIAQVDYRMQSLKADQIADRATGCIRLKDDPGFAGKKTGGNPNHRLPSGGELVGIGALVTVLFSVSLLNALVSGIRFPEALPRLLMAAVGVVFMGIGIAKLR